MTATKETCKIRAADIKEGDIIHLDPDSYEHLPMLIHVDAGVQLEPQHIGYDPSWTAYMTIPDAWMRKIYSGDVWRDANLSDEETNDELRPHQKSILYEYLYPYYKTARTFQAQNTQTRQKPPLDNLLETLNYCDDQIRKSGRSEPTSEKVLSERRRAGGHGIPFNVLNDDNIPICDRHEIQSEENIAKIAIEKMRYLSDEDEARYQRLLRDDEFMDFLNSSVERYIKGNSLGICRDSDSRDRESSLVTSTYTLEDC